MNDPVTTGHYFFADAHAKTSGHHSHAEGIEDTRWMTRSRRTPNPAGASRGSTANPVFHEPPPGKWRRSIQFGAGNVPIIRKESKGTLGMDVDNITGVCSGSEKGRRT